MLTVYHNVSHFPIHTYAGVHSVHSASTIVLANDTSNTNLNNNKEVQEARSSDHDETNAATKIQAHYRGYVVRKENKNRKPSETDSVFYKSNDGNPESGDAINHEQLTIFEMPKSFEENIQPHSQRRQPVVAQNEDMVQEKQDAVTVEQPHSENASQPQDGDQTQNKSAEQSQDEPTQQAQEDTTKNTEDNNSTQPQEDTANQTQEEIPSQEPQLQMESTDSVRTPAMLDASDSVSQLIKLIVSNSISSALEKRSVPQMEPPTPNNSLVTGLNDNPMNGQDGNHSPRDTESSPMASTMTPAPEDNSGGEKDQEDSVKGATEGAQSTDNGDKEQEGANTGGKTAQGGSDRVQSQTHTQENNNNKKEE